MTCSHPDWARLRSTLKRPRTVALIGESSDPDAILREVSEHRPTLILISLHPDPASVFGAGSRLPLLRELRARGPESKLLVIAREFTPNEALALHELLVEGVAA